MAKKTHYELILDLKADITSLKKDLGAATAQINSFGAAAKRIADSFRMTFARGLKQGFAIFAGGELLNMTKRLARGMWDLAKEGNKAADIVENFERLGGSADSIRKAQDAVLGTVSAFDLMKVANEGLLRGLPNLNNNFALLVDYAGRFAQASGKELLPTIQGLSDALGKGSAKALKEFGIFVQDGTSKSEVFSQALAQISQQMTVLAPMTRDVGTAQEELATAIKDAVTQIGMGITASDSLAGSFHEMAVSVREVDWKDVGQSFAEIATNIMDIGQSIASVMPSLDQFARALRDITGRRSAEDEALFKGAELQKRIENVQSNIKSLEFDKKFKQTFFAPDRFLAPIERELQANRELLGTLTDLKVLADFNAKSLSNGDPLRKLSGQNSNEQIQSIDRIIELRFQRSKELAKGNLDTKSIDDELKVLEDRMRQINEQAVEAKKAEAANREKNAKAIPTSPFAPATPSSPSSTDLAFANKQVSDLKAQVRAAIEQKDTGAFETLKGNLRSALEDAYIQSNQKFVEAGLLSNAQLKDDAIRAANAEISHYDQQMNGANQRVAAGFGKAVAEIGRAQVEVIQNDLARAIDTLDFNRFQQLIPQLQAAEERAFVEANKAWVDDRLMSMEELNNRAKVHAIEQVETWYQRISEREQEFADKLRQAHQDAVNTYNALFSNILNGGFSDWRQNLKDLAAGFLAEIAAGLGGALDPRLTNANGIGQVIGEGIASVLGDFFGSLQAPGSQAANYYGANTPSGAGGSSSFFQQLGNVFGSFFGSSGYPTTDQAHNIGIQGPGLPNGSFGSSVSQTDMAHAQGIQGPGMADGSFSPGGQEGGYGGYIQAATQIIGDIISARDRDKQTKSNQGTGAAAGGVIGAILGAFGGPMGAAIGTTIGSIVGGTIGSFFKWGPQNKETLARHQFANFLEDFFQKNNGLIVYDRNNQNPTRMTNFLEGPTNRFNDGKWADEFNAQGKEVSQTFRGLGEAFKNMLGITKDVGAQLGYLLGENLSYNINNARHLVKRLGLNLQDLVDKLVEEGLKGKRTWLEIESDIQGVNNAFKDGLVEIGAYDLAFKNLVNSGARGFEAVQAIRDIGVEAGEANIKTFDQLRALLLKTYDPKTVDAFFQALRQRGITNLDQLAKLDNRTAGGIVADMQALGANFVDGANEVSKTMADAGREITDNSSATRENSYYLRKNTEAISEKKVEAPAAPQTREDAEKKAYASGGVVLGPTVSLMGEAGPEAILPLTRVNGKLGVRYQGGSGGGVTAVYHIDARGAAPGTERRIRAAIEEAQERASRRTAKAMQKTAAEAL